jgi:cytoplasmic iron level regulating protein YaaA (DUF328/UPF0246 family)
VLILLPPSEGKAPSDGGTPFDVEQLSMPALNRTRVRVRDALVKLCSGRESRARQVLGISARQAEELDRNRELADARGLPASQVYTGVVFGAVDYRWLAAPGRRRAVRWVLVSSALWGVVRLDDEIAAYRLSGDVTLPRIGAITTVWRKPLASSMPDAAGEGVVLDLRSGVYARMWTPDGDLAQRTATARVIHERPDGSRAVVSHHNKATKGHLVRSLASQGTTPRSVEELAELIEKLGFGTELNVGRPGKPWSLDVVVTDL